MLQWAGRALDIPIECLSIYGVVRFEGCWQHVLIECPSGNEFERKWRHPVCLIRHPVWEPSHLILEQSQSASHYSLLTPSSFFLVPVRNSHSRGNFLLRQAFIDSNPPNDFCTVSSPQNERHKEELCYIWPSAQEFITIKRFVWIDEGWHQIPTISSLLVVLVDSSDKEC